MALIIAHNGKIQSLLSGMTRTPHLANVRLDERSFRRVENSPNKPDDWNEWKHHLMVSIRECVASFADYLWGVQKTDVPLDILSLHVARTQPAASLHSPRIALATGKAFRIVEMHDGDGVEGWRCLSCRYDPHTDARLISLILTLVNFKIKSRGVQGALVGPESRMSECCVSFPQQYPLYIDIRDMLFKCS